MYVLFERCGCKHDCTPPPPTRGLLELPPRVQCSCCRHNTKLTKASHHISVPTGTPCHFCKQPVGPLETAAAVKYWNVLLKNDQQFCFSCSLTLAASALTMGAPGKQSQRQRFLHDAKPSRSFAVLKCCTPPHSPSHTPLSRLLHPAPQLVLHLARRVPPLPAAHAQAPSFIVAVQRAHAPPQPVQCAHQHRGARPPVPGRV